MFKCGWCGKDSKPGELQRLVVTDWRVKTYPSKEMPPAVGSNVRRWSKGGSGYEAAVTKRSCVSCDKKDAPVPSKDNVTALQAA